MKNMYSIICIIVSLKVTSCYAGEKTQRPLSQSNPGYPIQRSQPMVIPQKNNKPNINESAINSVRNFVLNSKTFPKSRTSVFNISTEELELSQLHNNSVHFQNPPKQNRN